jgi:DNA-binding NtrC family response regulator
MSMPLQAKLLRILQEGEFERLGGREILKADIRIIAATNKDLAQEVQGGRFRDDLYWRLKVITIHLPSLRDRREDIPPLVEYFIKRFSGEYAKPIHHVSEGVLDMFCNHAWPGNVRELENGIRRAILLCTGDIITEEHISLENGSNEHPSTNLDREQLITILKEKLQSVLPDILRLSKQGIHGNIIEIVEETIIMKALEECGSNQVKAAKLLGISRNTLRHRLKKYFEKQDTVE